MNWKEKKKENFSNILNKQKEQTSKSQTRKFFSWTTSNFGEDVADSKIWTDFAGSLSKSVGEK